MSNRMSITVESFSSVPDGGGPTTRLMRALGGLRATPLASATLKPAAPGPSPRLPSNRSAPGRSICDIGSVLGCRARECHKSFRKTAADAKHKRAPPRHTDEHSCAVLRESCRICAIAQGMRFPKCAAVLTPHNLRVGHVQHSTICEHMHHCVSHRSVDNFASPGCGARAAEVMPI